MPGSAFAIEGDEPLIAQLDTLVTLLGGTAIHLTANEKTIYHAAAVIASNYTGDAGRACLAAARARANRA